MVKLDIHTGHGAADLVAVLERLKRKHNEEIVVQELASGEEQEQTQLPPVP